MVVRSGFERWWRGLGARCPECGQSGLQIDERFKNNVSMGRGGTFAAYDITLACGSCGYQRRFLHGDYQPEADAMASYWVRPPGLGKELHWHIGDHAGLVGKIRNKVSGPAQVVARERSSGAVMELACQLVDAACSVDADALGLRDAIATCRKELGFFLAEIGGTIQRVCAPEEDAPPDRQQDD